MVRKFLIGLPVLLFVFTLTVTGEVRAAAADAELRVPVTVHILADLVMEKRGRTLRSWVSRDDIRNEVLAEVNRIWHDAGIRFVLERVDEEPTLAPANKASLLSEITNARRDAHGKAAPERIEALEQLIDFSREAPDSINVYLVPYLGETSQGFTRRKHQRIVVGVWSDKHTRAKSAPEKVVLVESEPLNRGSLGRTLAHELGHALGLNHPDKSRQTEFGLLMGGRQEGYRLTKNEIEVARKNAARSRINRR